MLVERSRYLRAIDDESAVFYGAVSVMPMDAPVPSCPDWTVEDLLFHVGSVHGFWAEITARQLLSPNEVEDQPRPPADQLLAWARDRTAHLQAALAAADPATTVWTWARAQDVAFILRRMAHETSVHRWDAELVAGDARPIDPELASDGVDEFLNVMLPEPRFSSAPIDGSVHLHATDTPGEWLVRQQAGETLVVTAEHAKGDAALRGPASDLLLALWRRKGPDVLEVIGDRAVAERLLARTTVG
jgi:uncharacterized protein (TIGR03083 family)